MCMYVTSKLQSHKYTNMYRIRYQFRGSPAVTMGEFISLNRDRYQSSHYHKPKKKSKLLDRPLLSDLKRVESEEGDGLIDKKNRFD